MNMEVDYRTMPMKAYQIQNLGISLNHQLTAAWNSVDKLRFSWYGTRYNTLIRLFNGIRVKANAILKLTIITIPDQLSTIAQNYAKADEEVVGPLNQGTINEIETLAENQETTLRYEEGVASNVKDTVITCFEAAKNEMENIVETFNTIQWQSQARDSYARMLEWDKTEIETALDSIKRQFAEMMELAAKDMVAAENANDVNQ